MDKQMEDLKQKLKEQEKLASLGLLSAGIAHEIQNPLNFVINFSKISDKLLSDLTEIVEDNEDKLSDDDREEVEDIVADLKENMAKIGCPITPCVPTTRASTLPSTRTIRRDYPS